MPGISNYGDSTYGSGRYSYNPDVQMTASVSAGTIVVSGAQLRRIKPLASSVSTGTIVVSGAQLRRIKALASSLSLSLSVTGSLSAKMAMRSVMDFVLGVAADLSASAYWNPVSPSYGIWTPSAEFDETWSPASEGSTNWTPVT